MGIFKCLSEYGYNTANSTYIIAEIGINHGGKVELAKRLIESAARTGVDAVKFQTYRTEKRTFPGSPIFSILKECELPLKAFSALKKCVENCGLTFLSTPFDEESLDYLESLDCALYKLASFHVTHKKLIAHTASTGKGVILSVGMANLAEIQEAYRVLVSGTQKITLLHCISAYPTKEEDANLGVIHRLRQEFNCVIGQSDHTNDIQVPLLAVAAGAQVLEKHYRIDESMECIDAPVSITESQTRTLVMETRRIEKILGEGEPKMTAAQKGAEIFRRVSV